MSDLLEQLNEQKRKVDFDTFDISVKELVSMTSDKLIDIAPKYQHRFRLDAPRSTDVSAATESAGGECGTGTVDSDRRPGRALKRAREEKVARGEIDTEHPGYLGAQDTYYVGTIKSVGRIYDQTFIDTYAKVALTKLYDRKNALVAADTLNDRVLPFYEEHGIRLLRVLTDRGTEFCGNRESHEYQLYLAGGHRPYAHEGEIAADPTPFGPHEKCVVQYACGPCHLVKNERSFNEETELAELAVDPRTVALCIGEFRSFRSAEGSH